ncbi:hypothetical protein GE061_007704 [Apolygus lucorum]|uniref:Uncharacterized protein n=1 Tax=Apolygus lucorum TaxID=248454 RepID=A0A6A4IXF2_APOLU|nr:hypothetical protein GE061_007704 [Apolygus lucorum]
MKLNCDTASRIDESEGTYRGLSRVGVPSPPGRREDTVLRCLSFDDGTNTFLPSTSRVVAVASAPRNEVEPSDTPRITFEEYLPRHRIGTGTSLTLEEPRYWDMCHDDDVPSGVSIPPFGHPETEERDVPPGVSIPPYGQPETEERDVPPGVSIPLFGHPETEERDVPPGVSIPLFGHPETEERDVLPGVSIPLFGHPETEERDVSPGVSTPPYGQPETEERDVPPGCRSPYTDIPERRNGTFRSPGTKERDVSIPRYRLPNTEERDVPPVNRGTELHPTADIGAIDDATNNIDMEEWEVIPTDHWDEPQPEVEPLIDKKTPHEESPGRNDKANNIEMETEISESTPRYSLHPRVPVNYGHIHTEKARRTN